MEKKRRKFTQCPNCGYTFENANNFGPNSGQENHDLNFLWKHLMFSIHFHTFFFLLIISAISVEYLYNGFNVDTWVLLLAVVYLFFALHRVYKQSYWRTALSLIPLSLVYLLSVAVLLAGTVAASVWMS